ncbi:MAG TPA: lysylphosphatidylglycerol synthase transmembrane domain-containing protein [Chloroflexota bacterium]|nr:lysylphosphatidylglycerol synthase transmembrane domain-containing protein [Chloroflexota bacterium]
MIDTDQSVAIQSTSVPESNIPDGTAAWAPWKNPALLIRIGVFLVVTSAIVAGLIGWVGARDVLSLLSGISPGPMLLATLLTLTLPAVHAWRFRTVLNAIGYSVSWRRSFHLTMAAWPISSITPSKAGDLIKAYYLRKEVPASVSAGSLLAERAVDVAALGAMSLVGAAFFDRPAITIFSGLILLGIAGFFVLAPFARRLPLKPAWRQRVDLVLSSTYALSRSPSLMAVTLGLTLLNWVTTVLVAWILFRAVDADVPWLYTFAGLPPALFAGLIPFTLGGMGTRDSVIMLLFDGYATSAQSLTVGILYAFFGRWLLSILGIPFLQRLIKEG